MKLTSALLGLSNFAAASSFDTVEKTRLAETFKTKVEEVINFEERILTEIPTAVATFDQRYCFPLDLRTPRPVLKIHMYLLFL